MYFVVVCAFAGRVLYVEVMEHQAVALGQPWSIPREILYPILGSVEVNCLLRRLIMNFPYCWESLTQNLGRLPELPELVP